MIAHLRGELARIESDYAVIDVRGVGYKVHLPLAIITQLPQIGDEVKLLTSTIVKEDSFTLYGFLEEAEQDLFELLLTVSGVGPKAALNILSVLTVQQVVSAISSEHPQALKAPGVGTKTAQRIVLELKDKVTNLVWAQAASRPVSEDQRAVNDAIEGLVALGYNRNDAHKAAEEAQRSLKDKRDTGSLVRTALKYLSKG